ncbi:hypothetical protein BB561_000796 [Smittium simulii]|uniref:Uncharacterized protein n=1 Tax=Smittium simulii TaxID=133385 RepID=A0A2T9YXK6_9FUNG|nr:hypothetical protein BB561_000796 [Smittium simulii]
MKLAFFSTFSAISFQVVALFGSVFLTVMGYLFKSKAEEFTGSTHDPIDTDAVENAQIWLYISLSALATGLGAAILYLDFLLHFFGVPARYKVSLVDSLNTEVLLLSNTQCDTHSENNVFESNGYSTTCNTTLEPKTNNSLNSKNSKSYHLNDNNTKPYKNDSANTLQVKNDEYKTANSAVIVPDRLNDNHHNLCKSNETMPLLGNFHSFTHQTTDNLSANTSHKLNSKSLQPIDFNAIHTIDTQYITDCNSVHSHRNESSGSGHSISEAANNKSNCKGRQTEYLDTVSQHDLKNKILVTTNISETNNEHINTKTNASQTNQHLLNKIDHCEDKTCAIILNAELEDGDNDPNDSINSKNISQPLIGTIIAHNRASNHKMDISDKEDDNFTPTADIKDIRSDLSDINVSSEIKDVKISLKSNNSQTNVNQESYKLNLDYDVPKNTQIDNPSENNLDLYSLNNSAVNNTNDIGSEPILDTSQSLSNKKREEEMFVNGIKTAAAIVIHKFPEGFITFIAWKSSIKLGSYVSASLFFHNFSEGMILALPLYLVTKSHFKTFVAACLLGIIPPILGAFLAYVLYKYISLGSFDSHPDPEFGDTMNIILGLVFGFTAGMMITVSLTGMLPTAKMYDPKGRIVLLSFVGAIILLVCFGKLYS